MTCIILPILLIACHLTSSE